MYCVRIVCVHCTSQRVVAQQKYSRFSSSIFWFFLLFQFQFLACICVWTSDCLIWVSPLSVVNYWNCYNLSDSLLRWSYLVVICALFNKHLHSLYASKTPTNKKKKKKSKCHTQSTAKIKENPLLQIWNVFFFWVPSQWRHLLEQQWDVHYERLYGLMTRWRKKITNKKKKLFMKPTKSPTQDETNQTWNKDV